MLFLEHKHLYRQGYNRDPMPNADWLLAVRSRHLRVTRRPGDGGDMGRDRASRRGRGARARRRRGHRDRRPAHDLAVGQATSSPSRYARPDGCSIVHEDTLTCGFGAEVAAFVADECFEHLDAPVWRLAATDTLCAYEPSLENAILPQAADITRDLTALLAY